GRRAYIFRPIEPGCLWSCSFLKSLGVTTSETDLARSSWRRRFDGQCFVLGGFKAPPLMGVDWFLFPWVFLVLLLAGPPITARGEEITVFAAASLAESLKEIGANYEKAKGDKVTFNFGASSLLARQIEAGAPADLFFSADEARM